MVTEVPNDHSLTMRFVFLLFCLFALAHAQNLAQAKDKFVKKLRNIAVIFWNEKNLGNIADAVLEDIRSGFTMDQIAEKGIKYLTPNTPLLDMPKLLTLMNNMDKCLKGTDSKTFDVVMLAAPVLMNQLKGPYTVIRDKMVKMQGNKKPVNEQMKQAYILANAAITKPLIQKMISNSSKKMKKVQQWTCAVKHLATLIKINDYDTKKYN